MIQKISILGCGWLGLALAKLLITKGNTVKGSTTSTINLSLFQKEGIQPFLLDLKRRDQDWSNFLQTDILVIAIPSKQIDDFEYLRQQLLQQKVKKVIFISSTSVYVSANKRVNETSDLLPSPLVDIENLFRNTTQFQTTIIRFAGLMGYDRKPGLFLKEGKPLKNPMGYINLIHRDDCIEILHKIMVRGMGNEVFNACIDDHPLRKDFYTLQTKKEGRLAPKFEESETASFKIINSQKLVRTLDYTFLHADLSEV